MNIRTLIASYIPPELVKTEKDTLFETLVQLLGNEKVSKDPIVDQLFGFLSCKENIQTALGWLETEKISVGDQQLYSLQKKHKHSILVCLFKSTHFDE